MTDESLDHGYTSHHEFYCAFFTQIRQMGHSGANVSRVRIRNGLLVLKDDKLVANFDDGYHTTIYYDRKNMILGSHRTREGTVNIHEDCVEYDISRLRPQDFQRVDQMSWRWVNVGDPHFLDLKIEVAKQRIEFTGLYKVRKNEAVLDTEVAEKLAANIERVTLEEFNGDNYRTLANFLRTNRKMTSREVAELLGVDPATVEKWESMEENSLRFHTWGPVFRQDSIVGLIFWDPKGYRYKDIEEYSRLENELMESVRIR